ncbi:MAG: sugar phosphate nucleotidyltransferase [bacterium]
MKAIIPVAGFGTRLRPHTLRTPKALLHVAGKPILAHIVDELTSIGVDEAVLVVGYLGERIEAYAREQYGRLKLHFVQQGEPLGNGHAVYVAREHLEGSPVLIIFGDTIIKGDLRGLVGSSRAVAAVKEVEDPRRLGVVELDGNGFIQRVVEKPQLPPSNLAVVGAYYLKDSRPARTALERLVTENRMARGEFWLADALQLMIDAGEKMKVFRVQHWYDCGTVDALLQANRELLKFDPPKVPQTRDSNIVEPSYVDPAAEVKNSTIGPYASIAEGARISNSLIRDAIVGPNATVQDSKLEQSLVGESAVVRGRTGRVNIAETGEGEPP